MAGNPVPVPGPPDKILCIPDLQKAASKKLSTSIREFYNSGSTDQITIAENSTAYNKYRIRPRVLVDVSKADTSTTCLGRKISFPLCVSPAGLHAGAHPDGELATSRACATKGVNMGISSFANYPIKDIRSAGLHIDNGIVHGMQLYTMRDRKLQLQIIRDAEASGCKAIFLTGDSPVLGVRYNEWRNDFRTPKHLEFPIIGWTKEHIASRTHDSGFSQFNEDAHSWAQEIPWLRSVTKMEIWIKGVLTAEDTLKAIEMGCDGILVSNHGGRQLDGIPATIDALPECVEAAAGRIRIHIDGGIRSGTDIFKALALGAECCWVGRPALWGLAYDGQKGVELMLDTLHTEFERCMQLTGCNSVKDITRASLGVVRSDGPLARL
ncbi:Putative FMN-dependent dehydrogenase, FMN-dependent alpha-hydroxy acid dehydrogenase, active [Septoria linicola]|uniref:Oxidase FUB9 n=1 Tax=Septoria linicola TaxID=215465 RepID=A0A9Q9AG82_9PEZI|nr:putative FMN-dependent dehydrogenase, FMN-dependent alpha-hydroxy acid dehydrogenase, active [Septoria linicola]USW48859.1 Putative FMN-dependent dehydrogenase, FMN-dependent alpha-hydroxy acid dehydrogenase, active [Septoria linicola]